VIKDNVVHSIELAGMVFKQNGGDSRTLDCIQASHMKFYKMNGASVAAYLGANEMRLSNFISVDSAVGVTLLIADDGSVSDKKIKIFDGFIFGESSDVASDCPEEDVLDEENCNCVPKNGFLSLMGTTASNKKHPFKIKSYANWQTETEIKNVHFANFKQQKTSFCNQRQSAISLNQSGAD
jgi:hypothetical protein